MSQNDNEAPSWLTDSSPKKVEATSSTPKSPTNAEPAPAATMVSSANTQEMTAEDEATLRGIILYMRIANLAVSITVIVMASLRFAAALTNPQVWVLSFYAACGSLLICCMETQLSFIRTPMALNFGFLFNPSLRFLYYILLATICFSLSDLFSKICAGVLVGIALCNTYILIRYPAYRKLRDQLAKEEDARIDAAMREKVRKEAISAMFSRK